MVLVSGIITLNSLKSHYLHDGLIPFVKLTDALYGTVHNFSHSEFMAGFYAECKRLGLDPSISNFVDYATSKRQDYGKPLNKLIIGEKQIGKSTRSLLDARAIYRFRNKELNNSFVKNNIIWNPRQGFKAFGALANDVIIGDEMFFNGGDKRESMSYIQIKYMQVQNALAVNHNIVIGNMQELVDLDVRIIKATDILELIYETGYSLVFAKGHSFPIIKTIILDTKRFEETPRLLDEKERALTELKNLPTFICERENGAYPDTELWNTYGIRKQKENLEAIARINKTIDLIEAQESLQPDKELARAKKLKEDIIAELLNTK